jgi:hypothetical protein
MSEDIKYGVEEASRAVRLAHDELRSLHEVAGNRSLPLALSVAKTALDKLSANFDQLFSFQNASHSNDIFSLFGARLSSGISLSHAIVLDMSSVVDRLRYMKSLYSSEQVALINEGECRDVADKIVRYDGIVSTALIHHNMCVLQLIITIIAY